MTELRHHEFDATLFIPLDKPLQDVFEDVVGLLVALDDVLGPFKLRLGEDEPPGPSVRSEDISEFTSSCAGFMAMSAVATADVTKDRPPTSPDPDGVKVSLFLHDPGEDAVGQTLDALTRWGQQSGLTCAWAGSLDEERHHLFAKLELARGSVEAFVGRNHREYVPGLFWWNYWSIDWLASRGISLDRVPADWLATSHTDTGRPHAVVKGKFSWREWRDHVEAADTWVDETPGVFSIREMRLSKPDDLNELTAVRYLRRWK